LGPRGAFGAALLQIGAENEKIIALTSDLCNTSGLDRFRNAYPDRLINTGIAEQNMIGIASGLSNEGYIPFATTFATFAVLRGCEPARHFLGYMKCQVKLVGLGAGFAMGMFGNTHYGIEDIAIMRAIPNLTVLSPADATEVVKATAAAAVHEGPVYLRLTGVMNNPLVYQDDYHFEIGKAITLKEGGDLTIIATGTMVFNSLRAAELLESDGIATTVIDMHTIKPLDTAAIDAACQRSQLLVTVEEHSVIGGLGGAVAAYKSALPFAPPQLMLGVADRFRKAGDYRYMLSENGLLPEQLATQIRKRYRPL
jgi:transketolase